MFERASYYGLRAILVLYLTDEIFKMDTTEALQLFGWFAGSVLFSQIFGAIIGDFLIGNKRSIIVGGVLQATGAFVLCYTSIYGVYTGLLLVVIGSGLFTPNIISRFGKSYLNKTKLLDAGFTIFYFAINLGSFLGVLLISYLGVEIGFHFGFLICGILSLLSVMPILLTIGYEFESTGKISTLRRMIVICLAFLMVGIFWATFEIYSIRVFDIQIQLAEISTFNFPQHMWQSLSSFFTLPVCLIAIIFWTYYYNSHFFKLLIGFSFGVAALVIILLIPEIPKDRHTIYFLVALLFLSISEILVAPVINSILTKYANPKYLTLLISLAYLPIKLFTLIFGVFHENYYNEPNLGVKFSLVIMILASLGLTGYIILDRKFPFSSSTHEV